MPRGVYSRKKTKSTKGGRKIIAGLKQAAKHARKGEDIPTISMSQLTSRIVTREHIVEVQRGDTIILKIV